MTLFCCNLKFYVTTLNKWHIFINLLVYNKVTSTHITKNEI